jgi:hypothetical protein
MEPLLHFVLPLISLLLLREKPKNAALFALLGILPDMDAVLLVHRSFSHSIIVMILIFVPIYMLSRLYKPEYVRFIILGFLIIISHPVLDLGGYTPIFWPVYKSSIKLGVSLNGVVNEGIRLRPHLQVSQEPTYFIKYSSIDYPLFTYDGLMISLILLLPVIYQSAELIRASTQVE